MRQYLYDARSTHKGDIGVEICSELPSFFTGKQKLMDTAGRVERFRRKYAKAPETGREEVTVSRIQQNRSPRSGGGFLFASTSRIIVRKFWDKSTSSVARALRPRH